MLLWKMMAIGVLLLTAVRSHAAQTEPDVSHCLDLSAQPVPLAEVEFDGIIFTSHSDGTRAIRNPLPTTYVIGYSDHYRSFASRGTFSPDGRWFVYPTGRSYRINWSDRTYLYERMHFVNTYTGQRVFSVSMDGYANFVPRSDPILPGYAVSTRWISIYPKTRVGIEKEDVSR